jgi:hypothetical protein
VPVDDPVPAVAGADEPPLLVDPAEVGPLHDVAAVGGGETEYVEGLAAVPVAEVNH